MHSKVTTTPPAAAPTIWQTTKDARYPARAAARPVSACSSATSAACAPATPVAIPVVAVPAPATTTAALLLALTAAGACSPGDCQLSARPQWLPRSRGLPQGAPAERAAETVDAGRCRPAGPGSLHVPAGQPGGLHGQHHRQPVAPCNVQAADRSVSCRTMLASRVYHARTTMMF